MTSKYIPNAAPHTHTTAKMILYICAPSAQNVEQKMLNDSEISVPFYFMKKKNQHQTTKNIAKDKRTKKERTKKPKQTTRNNKKQTNKQNNCLKIEIVLLI
jgi:hypothetical protein